MTDSRPRASAKPAAQLAPSQIVWLVAAWLVPTVILGVPYLRSSYHNLESTGVVWGWGLIVLAVTAFVATAVGRVPWSAAAVACTAALLTVVWIRIGADVAIDPTDHNLWPFEIVIACVLGGMASLAGAAVGAAGVRLTQR